MKLEFSIKGAIQARLFDLLLCQQPVLMQWIKRQSKWIAENNRTEISRVN